MLQRGDSVPHFQVTTHTGEPFSYSTIWQRKNLVFIAVPAMDDASSRYITDLAARIGEFDNQNAECVVTRDPVKGMPTIGVVIADRWGEIVHALSASDVADLPPAEELLDWLTYVQTRCPECEGEAR